MKKTSILIAVFAVIAAASPAMAEVPQIDFDGKDTKTTSPVLNAKALTAVPGYDIPLPQEPEVEPMPEQLNPCQEFTILPWPMPCHSTPTLPPNCDPVNQGSWWWVAMCGEPLPWYAQPLYIDPVKGTRNNSTTDAGKANLAELILGYANTYPEFATSVMPIFKDKKASVVYDSKGAYIMSGRTVVRLDFNKLAKNTPTLTADRHNKIAPALEAVLYIVETGAAWYGAYQAWNEYHSSDNAPSDSGNNGGNNGGSTPPSHQDEWDIQHNIQRSSAAH